MFRIEIIFNLLAKLIALRKKQKVKRSGRQILKIMGVTPSRLSASEKSSIKDIWDKVGIDRSFLWHRFYKEQFGYFDARFVPSEVYSLFFENRLNPRKYSSFLQHKGEFYHFIPSENRPKTIINNISNTYYDDQNQVIFENEVVERLLQNEMFLLKPSVASGGGRNVSLVKVGKDKSANSRTQIHKYLNAFRKDFICQELVHQHDVFKQFNPGSVNTIRVMTLFINGVSTVLTSLLRIGAKDQFVDNFFSGGLFTGIYPDGTIFPFAFNRNWQKLPNASSGISLRGIRIHQYQQIVDTAIRLHQNIPLAGLIAWDMTIDSSGVVKVIEINLDSVDAMPPQIFGGSLFGERTEEVIQYCLKNPTKPILTL